MPCQARTTGAEGARVSTSFPLPNHKRAVTNVINSPHHSPGLLPAEDRGPPRRRGDALPRAHEIKLSRSPVAPAWRDSGRAGQAVLHSPRSVPGHASPTSPSPTFPLGAAGVRPAPRRGTPTIGGALETKSPKTQFGTSDLTTMLVAQLILPSAGPHPSLPAQSFCSDPVLDSCASTIIPGPLECLGRVLRATPMSPAQDLNTKALCPVLPRCQIAVSRATSVSPMQPP